MISSIQRNNETQYNFHHHASVIVYLYQLYPIIHYPIIHNLRREEHKLLFMCRYSKIPASNKVVHISHVCHGVSEVRKVCNYYVWVCKVGLFTADRCQKGVVNDTLLLVIASYSIDNSPIQLLKDFGIGIFCLAIIAVCQGMMRLVKKMRNSEK